MLLTRFNSTKGIMPLTFTRLSDLILSVLIPIERLVTVTAHLELLAPATGLIVHF